MSDEVAHEVLRAIRQIMRRVAEHSKHLSKEAGLTVPQLLCLKAIGEGDALTVAGVAEAVHLSSATTSRVIDRLVRAGLVARDRSPIDRRRVQLSLTAAGAERFSALPAPLQARFVAGLSALPEADRSRILAALHQLTDMMTPPPAQRGRSQQARPHERP